MLRTRLGVLLLFACGTPFAFFALPAGSAQQPAGAASRSQVSQPNVSQAAASPTAASEAAAPQTPPQAVAGPKLADLAWLEGRWRGEWGPRVAEQLWMAPKAGVMLGDFRLVENDKLLVLEFFTLVEKPSGINFYFRHFTEELVPWEKSGATLLTLANADGKIFEFENPTNGKPKRAILTRIDADTYVARSEIIPESGEPQVIEITYHRQPLAAIAPNAAAAHPKKK